MTRIFMLTLLLLSTLCAAITFPPRPGEREFIFDGASLLSESKEQTIRQTLDQLLTSKAIPIIVVTINSLSEYQAEQLAIESYARLLFDEWGIGTPKIKVEGEGMGRSKEVSWNKGILLLVSVQDRRARIELGADYGHSKDALCTEIMQNYIVPNFKAGNYEEGIYSGVKALESMAKGEQLPEVPRPLWHYLLIAAAIGLTIFTIVSLIRKGSSGWAWLFWAVVLGIVWYLLLAILRSKSSSGGFSGGSFGGGFSGGGGATGSW